MDLHDVQSMPLNVLVGDQGFEQVFKSHFQRLYAYAFTMLKEDIAAEEVVQNVFFKVWEKKGGIDIQTSVTAYLYRAVYHESLNYLKHKKVKAAYRAHTQRRHMDDQESSASKLQLSELEKELDKALTELPEQCRLIFQMSRFEELKYHEIAQRLGISPKTVENQMSKALKILRVKLADYLPLVIAFLLRP